MEKLRAKELAVFSFDLDGTLVSQGFADCVWLRGVPEAYAAKQGLSFEQAFEFVKSRYDRVGEERVEWYKIDYWLREFGLEGEVTREELFRRCEGEVRIYEETEGVLRVLKEAGFELVVCSNAPTEFVEFQIRGIKKFFSHTFSATSDFGAVKKSNGFYERVCEILSVEPQAVVHTGDHWVFDFLNPRKIGMNSFFLERSRSKGRSGERRGVRSGRKEEEFVLTDLRGVLWALDLENEK